MANRPEDDELLFRGGSMDANGALNRPQSSVEQRFEPAPEPELELARPTIPPQPDVLPEPAPEPKKSRAVLVIAAMVGLGVVVLVSAVIFKPSMPLPDGVRDLGLFRAMNAAKGQLIITSEPSGASVFIGDTHVGVTPWAADNRWSGEVKLRVVARGYPPFYATFEGGRDQTLEIDLKKRESHLR